MIPKSIKATIQQYLKKQHPNASPEIQSALPVSGGSINEAYQLKTNCGNFFVKYNDASRYPEMFEKEALGLKLLGNAGVIQVPEVLMVDQDANHAFLLLEYVDSAGKKANFWEDFAGKLAALHHQKAKRFGLDHDNYMGSLSQRNTMHDEWAEFFIMERLEPQVKLGRESGSISRGDVSAFERLYKRLDEIFPKTKPSLLHGDLWSGNFMVGANGLACIIDPAVYYGHPEIDIAMTTLFGGFSNVFYEEYHVHNPLEKGWQNRLPIINLYPLMIHVNLFGGGYLHSVHETLRKF
jgi:fructosamine-3-kinase